MAQHQPSDQSLALQHSCSPVTSHLHYGTAAVQLLTTSTMAQPQSSDQSLALQHSCSPVTNHSHYRTATVQGLITCTMAWSQSTSAMSHCFRNIKTTPRQGDTIQMSSLLSSDIMQKQTTTEPQKTMQHGAHCPVS